MKGREMASHWQVDGQAMENSALALMADMVQYMSVSDSGVGILMGEYEFLQDALFGLIRHNYVIDDDTLFRMLEESLRAHFIADKLPDAKKLLAEFDRRCGKLLSKQAEYVLITTAGMRGRLPKSRVINGCSIKFHAKLPKKYLSARDKLLKIKNPINVNVENEGYAFVEARVKSPTGTTAFMVAAEALAVFRALWQLHFGKNVQLFAPSGSAAKYPSDIAIKLGNVHTMHLPDGSAAGEMHWFEEAPNYSKPINIKEPEVIEQRVGKMLRKLEWSSQEYRAFCTRILLAFAEAICTNDLEARFVKLWLCLELLTGADDAKRIIKRVSFFYADQDVAKAQLLALRGARNSHVHAGAKPGRLGMKNFQLSMFVEHLLIFIISNHFKFTNSAQWHEFMSTTTDAKSIDEQIARLKMVKKFAAPSHAAPPADAQ
jgi:hypothetical protein